jgi:hypothetical protein
MGPNAGAANLFSDLSLSLDPVANGPNADATNLFPDLSLSLDSDMVPIPLAVDPSLSLGSLDPSPDPGSDFVPSTTVPSQFSDLSLSLTSWFQSVANVTIMFGQWFYGTAPALSLYGPDTQQTQDMMSAPGVLDALEFFYNKNAGLSLDQQQPVTNYNPGFDLSGLVAAGLNPTQQFVGNYRLDLYPLMDGTILIIASNTTSMTSLLYGLYPNAWDPPSGSIMGNSSQTYYWTTPNQSIIPASVPPISASFPANGGYQAQ